MLPLPTCICSLHWTLAGDRVSEIAFDPESAGNSDDSDSESEEAERSDTSEVAAKKRKRSKSKKTRKGRKDVKAMRKVSNDRNTFGAQVGENNKRKAVPDDSGPET